MSALGGVCEAKVAGEKLGRDWLWAVLVVLAVIGGLEVLKGIAGGIRQFVVWTTTKVPPPPPLEIWISPHGDRFHTVAGCGGLKSAGSISSRSACRLCSL